MDLERGWILQAQQGDQRAFGHLVQAYQRPVYNLAYRMLGDVAAAEEAAQEAFLRAYQHLGSYQPGRKFVNWLLSITSHYCIDQLRRQRVTWVSLEGSIPSDVFPSGQPTPEQIADQQDREVVVQRMLSRLPPDDRVAVVLRYWYDLSTQEIAQAMEISEGAVKSRLFRARGRLAGIWQEMEAEG